MLEPAERIVSDPEDIRKERNHIGQALRINNYPDWIIHEPLTRQVETSGLGLSNTRAYTGVRERKG